MIKPNPLEKELKSKIKIKIGQNGYLGYWCQIIDLKYKMLRKNGDLRFGTGYNSVSYKDCGYFKTMRELLSCLHLTLPNFKICKKSKVDIGASTYIYDLLRK